MSVTRNNYVLYWNDDQGAGHIESMPFPFGFYMAEGWYEVIRLYSVTYAEACDYLTTWAIANGKREVL